MHINLEWVNHSGILNKREQNKTARINSIDSQKPTEGRNYVSEDKYNITPSYMVSKIHNIW